MTDDGSPAIERWCPSCFATVADATVCPSCGMAGQDGADAARLRIVVSRIHGIASERVELQHELDTLVQERHQLFLRVRPATDDGASDRRGTAPSTRPEWRPERVRDVLLWLGALLLVAAAITFAAVAWARLGPAGRAEILLAVTIAAGALTMFVARRLRPTAEALAAITVALGIVTWGVTRHTTLSDGISDPAWWAIGLTIVAVGCAAWSTRVDLTAVRLGATTLVPVAAVFALGAWDPTGPVTVVALAAITTAVVMLHRGLRGTWLAVRPWLHLLAVLGEVAVAAGAIAVAVDHWADAGRAGAALAVLSVALAPSTWAWAPWGTDRPDPQGPAFVATSALLGAGLVAGSGIVGPSALLAALAVVTTGLVMAARSLPTRVRSGATSASLLAIVAPGVAITADVARAWLGPTAWYRRPWTGSLADPVSHNVARAGGVVVRAPAATFVVLACLAVLAFVTTAGRPHRQRAVLPAVGAALGVAVALAAADVAIGVALLVQLTVTAGVIAVAIVLDRRSDGVPAAPFALAVATVAAVPAIGWAAVSPRASMLALGSAIGLGAVAAAAFRTAALQAGAAVVAGTALLGGAAVVLAERDIAPAAGGGVIVLLAVGILVVTRLVRWPASHAWVAVTLEAVGITGAVVGASSAGTAPTPRLFAYALVTVALVAAAGRRDERARSYATAAVVTGALAGIAGLDGGRIPSEWITLPAAAIATVIALLPGAAGRDSARRFGPALLMAAITSVGLTLDRSGWRVILVVAVAGVVVAIGARTRQGAPIVVGGAALLVLAVDAGAPYAAAIPRWLLIGTAGVLALWAGATADRRLAQLHRWRDTFDRLD